MQTDLKFSPSFQSFVDTSFFHELARLKLEVFKLDLAEKELYSSLDLENITSKNLSLSLRNDSFGTASSDSVVLRGSILNFNTIESFKTCDKVQFIKNKGQELLAAGINKGLTECVGFYMISFADLKKYRFYHWVCMPNFQREGSSYELIYTESINDAFRKEIWAQFDFVACLLKGEIQAPTPDNLKICEKIVVKDFSRLKYIPAAVTKNYLTVWSSLSLRDKYMICFLRDDDSSFEAEIKITGDTSEKLRVSGWEKNGLGKLAPKSSDLSALMDPVKIAEQSIDLNLKLMKWRIAPDIDLERIKNTKALILGSGTLGCYVARALLAWGTRRVTFVDNSTVSFSNPVRQPLYNFEDCGRPKAEAASEALKKIFPSVVSTGYELEIPMIGHPIVNESKQKKDYEVLEGLIKTHDVVFLLMDARETRWLPSVLCRMHEKTVINAALGFDSYLVMRHGNINDKLGCYFCNDIVAPSDSLTDRTLDQMCTVTRPGVALLAAAQAVELLVTYLQPSPNILGSAPHQVRGFLNDFKTIKLETPVYDNCCASNVDVISTLRENGWNFVKQALNDYKCVEQLSGLSKVQEEAELALQEDIEFDEDDDFLID
ncbi:unnamed protein product [Kluyveromyces dobzhanskii CBS 2104]|uniref:Ubiquitin-like modifier-activating enzyme ATG7 n=1 Tax=Kluyveromyces dobzhanskii CBS 2104 TaxID=1427455 RepID=A0A0A8LD36_9SACH|nr:unnamed protein product [Kluyveromyces dobzhanskii CBS 2104]